MFVVLLKFSRNKSQAGRFMQGHQQWLQRGFEEGVFSLAGSLQPNRGGAIVAQGMTLAQLRNRVSEDPFVEHDVASAEILEISPSKTDERLAFLRG